MISRFSCSTRYINAHFCPISKTGATQKGQIHVQLFLRNHVFGVFAPFVYEGLHVGRKGRVEADHLLGARVDEAEGLGMEGLAGEELEAVLYELAVFRIYGSLADLRAVIA